jgi:hypothetical protein
MSTYGPPNVYTVSMIPCASYNAQSYFQPPDGYCWVVTDIDAAVGGISISPELSFADGFEYPSPVGWYAPLFTGPLTWQWRGRWRLTQGLWFGVYGGTFQIQATGYQLKLP